MVAMFVGSLDSCLHSWLALPPVGKSDSDSISGNYLFFESTTERQKPYCHSNNPVGDTGLQLFHFDRN